MIPLASLCGFAGSGAGALGKCSERWSSPAGPGHRRSLPSEIAAICQDFVQWPLNQDQNAFLGKTSWEDLLIRSDSTDIWRGRGLLWAIKLCFHKISLQKKRFKKEYEFSRIHFHWIHRIKTLWVKGILGSKKKFNCFFKL